MMFKDRKQAIEKAKELRKQGKKVKVKKVSFMDLSRAIVWFVE